jgi:hypothetical protein
MNYSGEGENKRGGEEGEEGRCHGGDYNGGDSEREGKMEEKGMKQCKTEAGTCLVFRLFR